MSRDQHEGKNHNIRIGNIFFERVDQLRWWEQTYQVKIPFMKKLRTDQSQGKLANIQGRNFRLTICYPKI
jgi:hypothetical protein